MDAPLRMPQLPHVMEADYTGSVWPSLRHGVEVLLRPDDAAPLSMESLSRAVYNACCCGFADRLQDDLLALIDQHARERTSGVLAESSSTEIEAALRAALPSVGAVFGYLDREYAGGRLLERMTQHMEDGLAASRAAAVAGSAPLSANKRRNSMRADGAPEGSGGTSGSPAAQAGEGAREAAKRLRSGNT